MTRPRVSVIIPVYNDPEGLRTTLESIVSQEFPKDKYEVLPVDNNSTDNTGEVIEEFEEKYPDLVRGLEENEIQGSYAARNKGIEEAKGEILVFTDADMWWDEDVLSIVKEEFEKSEADYIGAPIQVPETSKNIYSDGSNQFEDVEKTFYEENYVPTAFLAVRREVLDATGGFDEIYTGGDQVFGKRANQKGFEQKFRKDIQVFHPPRDSFDSILERRMRSGKAYFEMKSKNSSLIEGKRHPLNPRNFLPTLPHRIADKSDYWHNYSTQTKFHFFFFYWIRKTLYPIGYISAVLKSKMQ